MGLGPPVCMRCQLIYRYEPGGWYCGGCGDRTTDTYMFILDVDQQKQIEANTRFMRAVWIARGNTSNGQEHET